MDLKAEVIALRIAIIVGELQAIMDALIRVHRELLDIEDTN